MSNKTKIFSGLCAIVFIVLFSACKKNERRDEALKIVSEWIGKEIRFTGNLPCYVLGRDTLTELFNEKLIKEFKVLLYVDSTGCSSCRLKLFEWKKLIEEADSLFGESIGFLLFFQPKNVQEIIYMSKRSGFDYPIFIDTKGEMNRLNEFSQNELYQCFLLDKDNKVLSVGNPTLNTAIWELFKSQIANEKESKPKNLTSIILHIYTY